MANDIIPEEITDNIKDLAEILYIELNKKGIKLTLILGISLIITITHLGLNIIKNKIHKKGKINDI